MMRFIFLHSIQYMDWLYVRQGLVVSNINLGFLSTWFPIKDFIESGPLKSHFGISSNRKRRQYNTILSIQEFIIIRTNPLTDHCAKQREAHTSFSCYWPLRKSTISIFIQPMIAKFLCWGYSQCLLWILYALNFVFKIV